MDTRKRKEDLVEHGHLHSLGISSIIFFLILIVIFKSSPVIFSNSYNRFNSFNNSFTNFNKKILQNSLARINNIEKEKDYSSLQNVFVEAKSYVVYDLDNKKVLSGKNENDILPLASLTKVVTAITSLKLASPDTDIIIRKDYMRQDENLDIGMKIGQKWKLKELLKYGLTVSSNSSMDIIANTVSSSNSSFVKSMNDYVKELGFQDFSFNSASGLDYGDEIGGKGSALEYAKLFAKSYELIPDIMSYTVNSKVNLDSGTKKIYQVPNTNQKASSIVGLMASKTGYTTAAGGNLAVLVNLDVNRHIVIVVLGSSISGRFEDVNRLHNAIEKIFQK